MNHPISTAQVQLLAQVAALGKMNEAQSWENVPFASPNDILRLIAALSGSDLTPKMTRKTLTVHRPDVFARVLAQLNGARHTHFVHRRTCEKLCKYYKNHPLPADGEMLKIYYRRVTFDVCKMNRSLRRAILACLESFSQEILLEDMASFRRQWVCVGETLHPGDYARQFPKTFRAFCALRKKDKKGNRYPKAQSWNAKWENAVRNAREDDCKSLIENKPDQLPARLDWLMRSRRHQPEFSANPTHVAQDDNRNAPAAPSDHSHLPPFAKRLAAVKAAFAQSAKNLKSYASNALHHMQQDDGFVQWTCAQLESAPIASLMTLWTHLGMRRHRHHARIYTIPTHPLRQFSDVDRREPLNPLMAQALRFKLEKMIVSELSKLPKLDYAVIDASLQSLPTPPLPTPFDLGGARLIPGSLLALKNTRAETMRLLLHWCQKPHVGNVCLRFHAEFFDAAWHPLSHCSESATNPSPLASHRGFAFSAPYPNGATQSIDIRRTAAQKLGARFCVLSVNGDGRIFSDVLQRGYVGVAFPATDLDTCKKVPFKFALHGLIRNYIPLVVDLVENQIHFIDLCVRHTDDPVLSLSDEKMVRRIQSALSFESSHISRFHLALFHAAARCPHVSIRGNDGMLRVFHHHDIESSAAFLRRMLQNEPDDIVSPSEARLPLSPRLVFSLTDDSPLPPQSDAAIVFSDKNDWTDWYRFLVN